MSLGLAHTGRPGLSTLVLTAASADEEAGILGALWQILARSQKPDLRLVTYGGARWGLPMPTWLPVAGARAKAARVAQVLDLVGAAGIASRPIGELSGGEQQRILIAQALVSGARMLVLDEPLDSLDLSNQQAISGLIQQICRERDVTVLLVAHDVNPILPFLDRVVYVANGRVVAGRPEEVIRTDTLSRLYGTYVEVLKTSDGRIVVVGQQDPVSYHAHET